MTKSLDLVAIGRAGVDLYGQQVGGRLEDMSSFAKYVGGSPTNTAIGLARLGLRPALLTRVGADHMGRFITEQLVREGVDTRAVHTDPHRLTALAILGIRDREHFPLLFYRENCADMALEAQDVDEELISAASAILINGTHLSTDTVFAACRKAIDIAHASGGKVVLDIDYRPVLWGLTDKDMGENRYVASGGVTNRLQEVAALCDLIVGTEEEFHILGGTAATAQALANVRARTSALLVCKLGADGCVAFPDRVSEDLSNGVKVDGFPVEIFNVLGAGDAFMAGFLSGWLRDEPLEQCCTLANACGAIVVSRHGCAPAMPTAPELMEFLSRKDLPFRLRDDDALSHLHWGTTRRNAPGEMMVLAIDHRSQFEELARDTGRSEEDISRFKRLAFNALDSVAAQDASFGMIIDDRFGFDVLAEAAEHFYWIARPIETPKSRPLEFEGCDDVGLELGTWPVTHVVKCLAHYDVSDEAELRERQERQLRRLFAACRETGHELLLEIIAPADARVDDESTAAALRRLYELGIRPDWWKLEPTACERTWQSIVDLVEEQDPLCRGIVLLGLSAPIEELVTSFRIAAQFQAVKGFAVGRTVFQNVAREWFSGRITDTDAVEAMAARLRTLVDAWRNARSTMEVTA